MKKVKYLLIGGGLASHRAVEGIRRLDSSGPILMVCSERHRPYDRPPLTKGFVQGKVGLDKVFLKTKDFYDQNGVELTTGVMVDKLDLTRKTVLLSTEQTVGFEKALLATGGRPVKLNIPGTDLRGVHYFRTLDDAQAVSAEAAPGRRAVIIGAGFIGLELAASLTQRGVSVSVIQSNPLVWSRFAGPELSRHFQDYCAGRGVAFYTGQKVAAIQGDDHATAVAAASGKDLPCDFVCCAVGIVPNVELAQQAGLKVDNGVVADEQLRTSHPDVYAAGDILNFMDPFAGRRRRVEHWGQADFTGELAGQNMAGGRGRYDLVPYVFSDIFDLHLEFAGDEQDYQRLLVRGRLEANSFTVLYFKGPFLRAYFAVNTPKKEYRAIQKLMESRADLSGVEDKLQDRSVPVEELLTHAGR